MRLVLLIFCWGFLHLCSSEILEYNVPPLFFVVSLPDLGIRVMLVSQNEFGSFFSNLFFWHGLRSIVINSSLNVRQNSPEKLSGPGLFISGGSYFLFVCFFLYLSLIQFYHWQSICSHFSYFFQIQFSRFNVSRNFSISSMLSNLLALQNRYFQGMSSDSGRRVGKPHFIWSPEFS